MRVMSLMPVAFGQKSVTVTSCKKIQAMKRDHLTGPDRSVLCFHAVRTGIIQHN